MIESVPAKIFFGNNKPSSIPSDSETPDWDRLLSRVLSFDTTGYPFIKTIEILERENKRLFEFSHGKPFEISRDTVFVVSGQQAGLFGGPLYTLYKAMHSVRLAEILSEKTDRKVVPVFWVASDDHDFGEVSGLGIRTKTGEIQRLEYIPESYREGMPVGEIILDSRISEIVESFAGSSSKGEFGEKFINIIREAWIPRRKWSEAFSIQMSALFGDYGLLIIDPRWEGLKNLFREVFRAELENPLKTTGMINSDAGEFKDQKGARPIQKPENSTNLFVEQEGVRYPLLFEGGMFKAGGKEYGKNEIQDLLENFPEVISPGAVLRPVCQDFVLPVAVQICGPGERVYLSQLKPVYEFMKVDRPLLWPRASFTIADPKVIRISEKEGIPLEKIFTDIGKVISGLVSGSFPEDIERSIKNLEDTVKDGFGNVGASIGKIDSTLIDSVNKDMGKTLFIIGKIRERALRSHKFRTDIQKERLESVINFLIPQNKPQERWFGTDAILSMLEDGGFDEILHLTSPDEEFHRILKKRKEQFVSSH